ncbi:unnamed protein product [Lymnaea stagnalis]|uniref:Transcription elongation factor, mitochondrial n=1 Tax=Lymnaea stagnalis TaxID=6523 RepID=A0AAV2I992_LYMST
MTIQKLVKRILNRMHISLFRQESSSYPHHRQGQDQFAYRCFVSKSKFQEITDDVKFEDEEKILNRLNNFTSEQFRHQMQVTFALSEELCKHREANGPYLTLLDLKKVKSVGPQRFIELCNRLKSEPLEAPSGNSAKKERIKQKSEIPAEKYFTPEPDSEFLKSISTVTSLAVCIDGVYYTHMSKDLKVHDWNHIALPGSDHHKLPAFQILQQALSIVDKLPKSSIYLNESSFHRKPNPANMPSLIFIAQLQMALQVLLNKDLKETQQHKVFAVKNTFIIKALDLRVGGERISGQHIIKLIEDEQYHDKVSMDPELWQHYHMLANQILRERYSNCLLMALVFWQKFVNKSLSNEGGTDMLNN